MMIPTNITQYSALHASFISDVNRLLAGYIDENKGRVLALGPDYLNLSPDDAEKNLQLYRMVNKFTIPSKSDQIRASTSVEAMFDYDSKGLTSFDEKHVQDRYLRSQLQKARYNLQKLLKGFKLDFTNFDMPTGETYVSSNGNVSVFSKLSDIKQWVCSAECFYLFAKICYNSPALKYAAKQHMKALGLKHHKYSNAYNAFEYFAYKLKHVVTISEVSRITTVPKNKDTDRVILCEPMCNMIVQRCIAKALVSFINKNFELDLYNSQQVHGALISMAENATIDLKNASNSNWLSFIRWYLKDTRLLTLLEKSRIATVEYKDTFHHLNMIAPMGNGFTFEVMTLILLSITREFDSFSHVFGDDIIVDTHVASDVITLLCDCGYVVNSSKTFIDGRFRESCGSFYCERYLLSFDIKFCNNVAEAIATVNKIHYMSQVNDAFVGLHKDLLKVTPTLLLGYNGIKIPYLLDPRSSYTPKNYSTVTSICNFQLSDYVLCTRSFLSRRVRSEKKSLSMTHTDHGSPKVRFKVASSHISFSKKYKNWVPKKDVRGNLVWSYLYSGVELPTVRKERILCIRVT